MSTDVTHQETLLSLQVAEEIRAWMGRRRISGAQLARRLGVSGAWISYRLTGTQPIDLNDLQRIAAALEVDYLDLMPVREGRVVTHAGALRRQTTVPKVGLPKRPRTFGPRNRNTATPSTRRPALMISAAA